MIPLAIRAALSRLLLALGLVTVAIAVAIFATGGGRFTLAGVRFSLTSPWRALLAGAICVALYLALSPRTWRADCRQFFATLPARADAGAVALAVLTVAAGLLWGSVVGGGSDASGYVSQALLWREGRLTVEQPIVAESPWPLAAGTWTPLGFRPSESQASAMVPTYPPGYPLLMAAAQIVAGFCGAFLIVPLCGGFVVWLTYLLGRRLFETPGPAVWGALLVATSPAFLYQLMNPMSDVPVTAAWTLALVLLIDRRPFAAGLALAAAIAIRPNLVPVALVPFAWTALLDRKAAVRLAAGTTPGVLGIAALNANLYGSPFRAGYGSAADLFTLANLLPNLRLYTRWLFEAETPLVVLALLCVAAPGFLDRTRVRHARTLLGGMIAAVVLSYLFYMQFDSWTYLRFFLPVWPIVMVLAAAAALAILRRVSGQALPIVAAVVVVAVSWQALDTASRLWVFAFGRSERKYGDVAHFIAEKTDPGAVMLSMQHSGSLRLYSGRLTLRYDALDPAWLDGAVDFLKSTNRHPYIVLDQWELDEFRKRFKDRSRLGSLEWMPMAVLSTTTYVYDAATPDNALPPASIPSTADEVWHCHVPAVP